MGITEMIILYGGMLVGGYIVYLSMGYHKDDSPTRAVRTA